MSSCPECGTVRGIPGMMWHVDPSSRNRGRICSTCHASESQWPRNVTAEKVASQVEQRIEKARRTVDREPPHPHNRCGHICQSLRTPFDAGCCVCSGSSDPCSVCIPRTIAKNLSSSGTPYHQAIGIQNKVLEDIMGNKFTLSKSDDEARTERLKRNIRYLFHQTNDEAAKLIFRSGMKKGSEGLAGGGIYFAEKPEETVQKAHNHGVILRVKVRLGKVKEIPFRGDSSITLEKLLREGYDSVTIVRNSGREFVVYNSDQVRFIEEYAKFDGTLHRIHDGRKSYGNGKPAH